MPPNDIIIMKFGGTSVADVGRIKNVAAIISEYKSQNPHVGIAVVVSAMAGETNKLVALAKSCTSNPDPREMDVLLASGEQVTIALLAMALQDSGISAKSFLASQIKIRTDDRHTNARIQGIDSFAMKQVLENGSVAVVAGFQGVTENGDLTTLGRGGSDITAVALAAALDANACFIYTDVPGIFTTDPRIVSQAKLLKEISHVDMLELASLGAKVLHTRSVYFAKRFGVKLVVLSTFHGPYETGINGTDIIDEEKLMEKSQVTGISYRLDEARITVESLPESIEQLALLFETLGTNDIPVDMITQSPGKEGICSVSFTVPDEVSSSALQVIRDQIPRIEAQGVTLGRDIAKISLVGVGMRYHTDIAGRLFRVLAENKIPVELISATETKLSFLSPRKYCELAVKVTHQEFIEIEEREVEEKRVWCGLRYRDLE